MTITKPTFQRIHCKVKDLQPVTQHDEKTGRKKLLGVNIDGLTAHSTERFMTSLAAKYGYGKSIFDLFTHEEVFTRICEHPAKGGGSIVLTIENTLDPTTKEPLNKCLAISGKDTIRIEDQPFLELLNKYDIDTDNCDYGLGGRNTTRFANQPRLPQHLLSQGITNRTMLTSSSGDGGARKLDDVPSLSYMDGIFRSIHTPNNCPTFTIAGDAFQNRFVMDTPIDGYGKPSLYLMLMREVCTNGAVGWSAVFRTHLSLGKGEDSFEYPMVRAFEGFNNEEGFSALRLRFEAAANSWASISNVDTCYKALVKMHNRGECYGYEPPTEAEIKAGKKLNAEETELLEDSNIIASFHTMCGDLHSTYGLANLGRLSLKRQRTLPAGCTVYDLLNFMSEVATHYTKPIGSQRAQAIIGGMVANEYDLEGTYSQFPNWKDFLISNKDAQRALDKAREGKK